MSSRSEWANHNVVPVAPVIEWPRLPFAESPLPLTSLIGREDEIATVREILLRPRGRLVTRTGPGGVAVAREAHQDEGERDAIARHYRVLSRGHGAVIYTTLRDHQGCLNSIPSREESIATWLRRFLRTMPSACHFRARR